LLTAKLHLVGFVQMAARDVRVEKSTEDTLQQIQHEYLARYKQEAPAAIAQPHSAEVMNINAARRRANEEFVYS